jgi:hypothetical protein
VRFDGDGKAKLAIFLLNFRVIFVCKLVWLRENLACLLRRLPEMISMRLI